MLSLQPHLNKKSIYYDKKEKEKMHLKT